MRDGWRWRLAAAFVAAVMAAAFGATGRLSVTTAAFDRLEVEPLVVDFGTPGSVQSAWLNGQGLPDPGVPSNYGLILAKSSTAAQPAFAGATVLNVSGLTSVTELGFDFRLDTPCFFEPMMRVDTRNGRSFAFPCRTGTHTLAPGGDGFWDRVRFKPPAIPPGDAVAAITVQFGRTEQGPSGARLDNIDVNGTLIGRPLPRIAFQSERDGNIEIYLMYDDGANQTRLTTNSALDGLPALSPDRKKICFSSDRDGDTEIYVMNADGTTQTRITNSPGNDGACNWSPDGSKIVFTSERSGDFEIYVMNADGTNPTRLTFSPGQDSEPEFRPAGLPMIVFTHDTDIYVMNVDGSNQTRLTTDPATDSNPSFSPNGLMIAFESNRNEDLQIYVMNADGTNQVNVSNNSTNDFTSNFMPDGRIVFGSDRDGGNVDVYVMNADGTNPTRLTSDPARDFSPAAR